MTTREFVGIVTKRGNRHRAPHMTYHVSFKRHSRVDGNATSVPIGTTLSQFMRELVKQNRKAKRKLTYHIEDGVALFTLSYAGHTRTGQVKRHG
jgi:hypothetical protein